MGSTPIRATCTKIKGGINEKTKETLPSGFHSMGQGIKMRISRKIPRKDYTYYPYFLVSRLYKCSVLGVKIAWGFEIGIRIWLLFFMIGFGVERRPTTED